MTKFSEVWSRKNKKVILERQFKTQEPVVTSTSLHARNGRKTWRARLVRVAVLKLPLEMQIEMVYFEEL